MISQQIVQKIQKRGAFKAAPRFFVSLFIGFCLCVLSGCSKKQSKALIHNRSVADRLMDVRQREARMVAMPLPVGGVLMPTVANQQDSSSYGSILTYSVVATHEALVRFYKEEMMRLGWNKVAQSSGDEEMLIFESPLKVAIIQMRPEKSYKGWKKNKKIILTLHETVKEN